MANSDKRIIKTERLIKKTFIDPKRSFENNN